MLLVLTSAEQARISLQSGKSYRLMPALRVQPVSGLQVRMHSHLSDHFWLSALEKKWYKTNTKMLVPKMQ